MPSAPAKAAVRPTAAQTLAKVSPSPSASAAHPAARDAKHSYSAKLSEALARKGIHFETDKQGNVLYDPETLSAPNVQLPDASDLEEPTRMPRPTRPGSASARVTQERNRLRILDLPGVRELLKKHDRARWVDSDRCEAHRESPSITLSALRTDIHNWESIATDASDQHDERKIFLDFVRAQQERVKPEDLEKLMAAIQPLLDVNAAIPITAKCTHPASVFHLTLKDPNKKPPFRGQYSTPLAYRDAVTKQVDGWWDEDVIELASPGCQYNSALNAVRKKDTAGNWTDVRTATDFRPTNDACESQSLPIPSIPHILEQLKGFTIATGFDLRASFTQFLVAETSRDFLTFTWGGKRYRFKGAPYGLTQLPGHFQRVMEIIFSDCMDFVIIFIDDICVFSKSLAEHIVHVTRVLELLNKFKLRLRVNKCHFGCTQLLVLGQLLSGDGRLPDPAKLDTLMDWPRPHSCKDIQVFLGFANYLRDYCPHYATVAAPLDQLRHSTNVDAIWDSSDVYQLSFDTLKALLCNAAQLSFMDPDLPLICATDASKFGIGAVLFQDDADGNRT